MKRSAPQLSVVIPYLSESDCIGRCRELVERNTRTPFEICEIVDCPNVYRAYNDGVAGARGEIVALINDDMFVAPDWDVHLVAAIEEKTVVTTYLVESGRLPVNYRNIARDFGKSVEEFDYERFVGFATERAKQVPETRTGLGWYMPMAVRRKDFLPFPREDPSIPCDTLLFGVFASRHYRFVQARSFAYHLQRMSQA
ncbi:MAG TPA: glycosyltransferase [Fimbriimonadaceae bacterium]|nr:glycosyltransferase [Fimbriimonadaceae bacterium]